jgi:hypothetical protein
MDEKTLLAHGGTPANWYNSAGYGPEGKGIKHEYWLENSQKSNIQDVWNLPQNSIIGSLEAQGIYSGNGSITYTGEKDYDFSWKPIDKADAIAKRHDMNYASVHAYDVVEDTRTLYADKQMVREDRAFLKSIPLRLLFMQRVAGETAIAAKSQEKFIGILADYKEWKTNYMLKVGLNPANIDENKKVSLSSSFIRAAYVNSDENRVKERLFNLGVLLTTKSQINDEKNNN